MKTFSSQSQPEQRGALCTLHSLSSGAMSPLSTASVTLAVLFILTIPASTSAPVSLQQVTTDQRQLLRQIDAVCSSYLSAGLKYWTSDVIGELCILMLVQKSKELRVQENSKRLHPRRERGLVMSAELQGPGGIESRGYFLYRVCVRQVVTGSKSCTLNNRNYKLLFALIATKWKTVFRI
ncbi:neuromedin-U isoform X4 [Poeciliopsis prolifica]|uniref:neuromedin-U isoform X4 n=1 Tax=Poeciliopsis prolifica TaxID=188132 RepID=UPI002413AF17|nr:neuromedin-U isoform X4 [Poeciliopsis prolifica]